MVFFLMAVKRCSYRITILLCVLHTLIVTAKPTASRYCPLWTFTFGLPFKVLKTHRLGRSFFTLIRNASFSSPTDVGSHKEASVLGGTPSGDPTLVGERDEASLISVWKPLPSRHVLKP